MEKDTRDLIDIDYHSNKKPSKTVSIKKKDHNVAEGRTRFFTLQVPPNFVPHPKAIKAKKSPTPMLLNSSPKPIRNLRHSFKQDVKDKLYLSFEEIASNVDSDESFDEDTLPSSLVSDVGIANFRKELSYMKLKQNGDINKYKDFEDGAMKRMSLISIDKKEIIPLCRRLSLECNEEITNEKGCSILNILELAH